MDAGMIILVCIVGLTSTITALLALLTQDRTATSRQARRRFFLPAPLFGTTDPHKSGFWYNTNWFVVEKVNEAIMQGKARSAHRHSSHAAHRQPKRSRHAR
jgi:hypothetical protein